MTGTLLNTGSIILGSFIGILFGSRIPERFRNTILSGLGLFTMAFGVSQFLKSQNIIYALGGLLIGAVLGEWWHIENGLQNLGIWLEKKLKPDHQSSADSRFVNGLLTASLLFCIGPLAILGSIQDGLTGDYQTLMVKAVIDGFASMAFASTLGVGVAFSAFFVLLYQGGISILAAQVQMLVTNEMMAEMTAVGGLILIGITISSMLELRKIRVGNFLPGLIIAPVLVALVKLISG